MRYFTIIGLMLLAGCSQGVPVHIGKSQSQYIGVWQFLRTERTNTTLDVRDMLLVIRPDSTMVYRKCFLSESKGASGGSSSSSSRVYVSLPNAVLTGLTTDEMTFEQKLWIFHFHYHLTITKAPYRADGQWYVSLDNTVLRKLQGEDLATTNWTCPDTTD